MDDDGVALQATNHPLHITDEMRAAGARAISDLIGSITAEPSGILTGQMAEAAFTAMVYASPPEPDELNEAALENALVEIELHKELSRRDWFAAHAPPMPEQWFLDSPRRKSDPIWHYSEASAAWAYTYADAMLKARKNTTVR